MSPLGAQMTGLMGAAGSAVASTNAFNTSVDPEFHFDATMVDGSSTAAEDNPVNGQIFDGTTDTDNPTGGVWTSRVGSAVTTAQGTASLQPTYYTSGTNSQPYFDWSLDYLAIDPATTYSGAFTNFAVMEQGDATGRYLVLGGRNVNNGQGIVWFAHSNGTDYYWFQSSGYVTEDRVSMPSAVGGTNEADYTDVTRMYLMTRATDNTLNLFADGNNTNTDAAPTRSTDVEQDFLGRSGLAGYSVTGHIYEVAFWDSDLSTADRNAVVSYVNSKYGVGRNADDSGDLARVTF